MNWRRTICFGLFTAGWLAGPPLFAAAAPGEMPYTPIVERNVFGLVPIPVAPPPVDPASLVPPPKITPTGIMTLFGKLQVLFKVAGVTKPGQPPKDESYVMCVGDRQDDIEVQKVDEKAAVITFNNHGVVQELPLVAATTASSTPAPTGRVPMPRLPLPAAAPADGGAVPVDFGTRLSRGQKVTTGGNPDAGNTPGFGGAASTTSSDQPQAPMSVEQQVLMIEAQRLKAIQEGDPIATILPPTELTSQVTGNPADGIPTDPAPPP